MWVAGCELRLRRTITMTITISATCNLQLRLHFGLRNSVSCSRKQALAFGKKPNARFAVLQTAIRGCASAMLKTMQILALHSAFTRFAVLQTAIRGCASAMLKTMQILALHSAFTRIQGTEVSGIGKNAQSGVFFSNFAPWFRSTRSWAFFRS